MNSKYILTILLVSFSFALHAQCYTDRHSTDIMDSWLSCDAATNPNPTNPDGHWVQYDLGGIHPIHDIHVWNMNHPDFINFGFQDVKLDYSDDGVSWTSAGTFTIPKAFASSFYEGYKGINLKGQTTRFLLFTGLTNYSGPCFGLAEIKAYTTAQVTSDFAFDISTCESDGALQHLSFGLDMSGFYSGPGVSDNGDGTFSFDSDSVGPGIYTLRFDSGSTFFKGIIEVYSCENNFCTPCSNCDNFIQADLDRDPIPSDYYYADTLHSLGAVRNFDNVFFRAENQVTLQPGFEVEEAMDFVSEIRDCQTNIIRNPSFEDGLTSWKTTVSSDISASIATTTLDAYENVTSAIIHANTVTGEAWRLVLQQQNISLIPDQEYMVSFVIKSDHRSTLNFRITAPSIILNRDLVLDPYWNFFRFKFTPGAVVSSNLVSLKFQMGLEVGEYWLDHVRLEKVD